MKKYQKYYTEIRANLVKTFNVTRDFLKHLHRPNFLTRTWELVSLNWTTLVKFELLFKLCAALVFAPLAIYLLGFAMKVTGYNYLTLDNLLMFLVQPVSLLVAFALLVLFTFITMFDIGAALVIFDESYHGDRVGMFNVVKFNFRQCSRLFKLRNLPVAFLLLFLAPFLNVGFGSNFLSNLHLPSFIGDYIDSNRLLSFCSLVLYIFLLFIFSNWLYVVHYMVLENKSFKAARVASYRLVKNHRFGDLARILLSQFVLLGVLKLFIFLGELGIRGLLIIAAGHNIIESFLITLLGILLFALSAAYLAFSNVFNYAVMSALFYRHKQEQKEKIGEVVIAKPLEKKQLRHLKEWVLAIGALAVIGGYTLNYLFVSGRANLRIEALHETEITAHRGDSLNYPENTMSAFMGAVEAGANWIELDVQQTHDKMIVVSHDASLSRTAGVKKYIYELDYDEIQNIEIQGYYGGDYIVEHIPSLAEVLVFAEENNMRLNIEIKPNSHDSDIEAAVVDLVDQYYNREACMISSLDYETLRNVKEYAPSMRTLYTTSLAAGEINTLEYADAFSVEASSISSRMVRRVHNEGKEIFAWTVNTDEEMRKVLSLGVDNVITDNAKRGREVAMRWRSGNWIEAVFVWLDKMV